MSVLNKHNVFFIGIGGIGMSALARYFHEQGKKVSGYDKTPSEITSSLESIGIEVHFEDSVELISNEFLSTKETLVVYTPAIPKDHSQLNYFLENDFDIFKRSKILGMITENTKCLAVAGTHGKTTTTSILAHILNVTNISMTAFLGGISENYNSNFIQNGYEATVVEADEFDRSFLNLSPNIAAITSMDADHLDIYGKKEELIEAFKLFAAKIKDDGKLIIEETLPLDGIRVGFDETAHYRAINIKIKDGSYYFDLKTPNEIVENIQFNLPGRHNVLNALIALAMAIEFGGSPYSLAGALASYKGVKRRFSIHIKTDDLVYIDDYAHHPEEINAVHQAVREFFPEKKVLVIFQPHLYSRTNDFVDEFAQSLSAFDEVLLMEIYPARELPIPGVNSEWLLGKIKHENKGMISREKLLEGIENSEAQVILTLGAGDIGNEVLKIKEKLKIAS